jgi:peroxiredoxin (alkyl hydroperoxide reductase subunit C)
MIGVGSPAPDFTLVDHNKRDVTLSGYRGRKNVVLSFHVYTFTDG